MTLETFDIFYILSVIFVVISIVMVYITSSKPAEQRDTCGINAVLIFTFIITAFIFLIIGNIIETEPKPEPTLEHSYEYCIKNTISSDEEYKKQFCRNYVKYLEDNK